MADSENIKRTTRALEDAMLKARLTADCLTAAAEGRGQSEPAWISLYSRTVDEIEDAANALLEAMHEARH